MLLFGYNILYMEYYLTRFNHQRKKKYSRGLEADEAEGVGLRSNSTWRDEFIRPYSLNSN